MMTQQPDDAPRAATRLLARAIDAAPAYATDTGTCCFCGVEDDGVHADEATSAEYFSDDPLLTVPSSDHVCAACAWAMDQRQFKQGHWLARARTG